MLDERTSSGCEVVDESVSSGCAVVAEVVEKVIRVLREPGVALGMSVAGGVNSSSSSQLPDNDTQHQVNSLLLHHPAHPLTRL